MTAQGDVSQIKNPWVSLTASAFSAILIGFASTILVVMQAAQAVHASPAEQISWAAVLCFGMAISSLLLSWWTRIPVITAWSTPGAVVIITGGTDLSYATALGAFVVAGFLTVVTALVKPLARAIANIPASLAAGMLAGVLLNYSLKVPQAALDQPLMVLPLVVIFFVLRLRWPLYAVPVVVGLGVLEAIFAGDLGAQCCVVEASQLIWVTPVFDVTPAISLGFPLFLVTMAAQNLPGFAVLKVAGYEPPVKDCLLGCGLGSMMMAPFGGHSLNMAAITAALVTGPETHPDPARRWLVSLPYAIGYGVVGVAAGLCLQLLNGMPAAVMTAIVGLALFSPLMAGLAGMVKEPRDIESAVVTFLVAASGVSIFGIGSAFWGLVAGLIIFGARHLMAMRLP